MAGEKRREGIGEGRRDKKDKGKKDGRRKGIKKEGEKSNKTTRCHHVRENHGFWV